VILKLKTTVGRSGKFPLVILGTEIRGTRDDDSHVIRLLNKQRLFIKQHLAVSRCNRDAVFFPVMHWLHFLIVFIFCLPDCSLEVSVHPEGPATDHLMATWFRSCISRDLN
jgi:hypothetical protein